VRVRAVASVLGSALVQRGRHRRCRLGKPLVRGTKFAGTIASGPRQGERVAVDPRCPVESANSCLCGDPNLCTHLRSPVTLQRTAPCVNTWPGRTECLHPLPGSLSYADGAMLEPLGVALHAFDLEKCGWAAPWASFGAGPIGLLILQTGTPGRASAVFVTDILLTGWKRRGRGCHTRHQAGRGAEAEEILQATSGSGVQVASKWPARTSVEAPDRRAAGWRLILAGIPANDRTSFSASMARRKGLTIKLVRRMKFTYPRAIALVQAGRWMCARWSRSAIRSNRRSKAFSAAAQRTGLKTIIEI